MAFVYYFIIGVVLFGIAVKGISQQLSNIYNLLSDIDNEVSQINNFLDPADLADDDDGDDV